ncbi:MAG: chloride channel protein [Candidatus Nezhaarchaeales archaeon]
MERGLRLSQAKYIAKWLVLSIWSGIFGGLAAIIFTLFLDLNIEFFYFVLQHHMILLIPLLPAFGGLIVGLINYALNREAFYTFGSSESALETIHEKYGYVSPKKPLITLLTSSISIGTGNSVGKEFPAVEIGVGFGAIARKILTSLRLTKIASWLRISRRDSRIIAICGASSALAGIFNAPLGGAFFGSEMVYQDDIEISALGPALLSSIVGVALCWWLLHLEPPFNVPHIENALLLHIDVTLNMRHIISLIGLGALCGLVAVIFVRFFDVSRSLFSNMKIPIVFRPAIGGLLSGFMVLATYFAIDELYLWGLGYDGIDAMIAAAIPASAALLLAFTKIAATSFVICSGGAGGTLIPSFFVGSMIGGAYFYLLSDLMALPSQHHAAYAVAGLCALASATTKIPMSSVLLVCEMAGNFTIMPAILIASIISFLVSRPFNITLYKAQKKRVGLTRRRRVLDFLLWFVIMIIGIMIYEALGLT